MEIMKLDAELYAGRKFTLQYLFMAILFYWVSRRDMLRTTISNILDTAL